MQPTTNGSAYTASLPRVILLLKTAPAEAVRAVEVSRYRQLAPAAFRGERQSVMAEDVFGEVLTDAVWKGLAVRFVGNHVEADARGGSWARMKPGIG